MVLVRSGINHGIAECQDCDWRNECHKNAQATGSKHATHYGHRVTVEVGMTMEYQG